MFSFCVPTLGPHQQRRTDSRNALTPKTLQVPHSIATERFENFVLTTSEDPINHTAVSNEKKEAGITTSVTTYKIVFRLPTSVTN